MHNNREYIVIYCSLNVYVSVDDKVINTLWAYQTPTSHSQPTKTLQLYLHASLNGSFIIKLNEQVDMKALLQKLCSPTNIKLRHF